MFCRNMVGMTFKHFKGGEYKVEGVHSMQHHWEGVPDGQGLVVVRYVRVQKADGSWDDSGEEYLQPFPRLGSPSGLSPHWEDNPEV